MNAHLINMRTNADALNNPDVVRIDRETRWGNPFRISEDADRATVIELYRAQLCRQIKAGAVGLEDLAELADKRLACWCDPEPCHGEVLHRAAQWAREQLASRPPEVEREPPPIDSFSGDYAFLSNFYRASFVWRDTEYLTAEHAFQAAKTRDPDWHAMILAAPTPGKAKRLGRRAPLRSNWEAIKDQVMLSIVWHKFAEPALRELLRSTAPATLIEGNNWGDQYWGVCNGVGQNRLGHALMAVRDHLPT